MLESILWCVGISVFLGVFIGVPYVKGVSQRPNNEVNNKRDYVVANLDKFGVKDGSSSADDKQVYLVSHERMGFR